LRAKVLPVTLLDPEGRNEHPRLVPAYLVLRIEEVTLKLLAGHDRAIRSRKPIGHRRIRA
jgi:hypothetical protein